MAGHKGELKHKELRDIGEADHHLKFEKLEDDSTPKLGADLDANEKAVSDLKKITFKDFIELTIASNAVTVTQTCHSLDTEGDAASDDLETINGGTTGQLLFIHSESAARVITIKHAVDNIILQGKGDIILDEVTVGLFLMCVNTAVGLRWMDVTKLAPDVGWELVESKILTSNVASVSFPSLSSEYNAFRLTCFIKRTDYGSPIATGIRFNDDNGANYDYVDIQGNGTTASSTSGIGQAYALVGAFNDTHYGIAFVYIQNRLAGTEKEVLAFAGLGSDMIRNISNRWNNTSALINKITVLAVIGNLLIGSQFILEGCKE